MSSLVRGCLYAGVVALATLAAAPASGAGKQAAGGAQAQGQVKGQGKGHGKGQGQGPRWQGSGGWGEESGYQRLYDPKAAITVRGQVTQLRTVQPMRGMSRGVQLMLRTDTGLVPVHLGPEWYVGRQDVRIQPNDTIEVTGARVTLGGRETILASQVVKGDTILVLRDSTGIPMWAWGRAPAAAAAKP